MVPLPPPITGQSLACRSFLDALITAPDFEVDVIDTMKGTLGSRLPGPAHVLRTLRSAWRARRLGSTADVIYMNASQSVPGNLKDLILFWIMGREVTSAPPSILLHLFLKPDNSSRSTTVINGDPEQRGPGVELKFLMRKLCRQQDRASAVDGSVTQGRATVDHHQDLGGVVGGQGHRPMLHGLDSFDRVVGGP